MKLYLQNRFKRFWNGFSERQKRQIILALFIIFGASSIIFGVLQVRYRLMSPFFIFTQFDKNINTNILTPEQEEIAKMAEAKTKDTDSDGLNDYDEQYVHKTSIYLPDTDGDGYSDKQEIESGHSPLCPSGIDCMGSGADQSVVSDQTLTNPADMRKALVEKYGYTESDVVALSDDQVKQQYVTIATQPQAATATSPAQILREAILQSGIIDEKALESISDDDLIKLYEESFSNTNTQSP